MALVKIAANAVVAKLIDTPREIKDIVSDRLSYAVSGAQFSTSFQSGHWDGQSSFFNYTKGTFPVGFLDTVERRLRQKGHRVQRIAKPLPESLGVTRPIINAFGYTDEYDYQPQTVDRLIERGRMVAQLATGCHAIGTKILMFDGSLKSVEDVTIGDVLMGPDSSPRNVMSLHRGFDEMFKITPHRYGDSFVVNGGHILSLEQTSLADCRPESINNGRWVEVSVYDFLNWPKNHKHIHKLHRSRGVKFERNNDSLPIEPYMLGLLLGDGYLKSNSAPSITSADPEIATYLQEYCDRHGMSLKSHDKKGSLAKSHVLSGYKRGESWVGRKHGRANPLRLALNSLRLTGHKSDTKFIPDSYKLGSRETRLAILAGLIDTDGHLHNGGYDFVSKSDSLASDFAFIARSLGFGTSVYTKTINSGPYAGNTYTRVHIAGESSQIPVLIERKKADIRRQKKDVCLTGFSIEEMGYGEYFGFEVDEDNLYLMGDFTITHNSGKSNVACMAVARIKRPALFLTTRGSLMYQMQGHLQASIDYRAQHNNEPELEGVKVGVIGDGVWEPRRVVTVAMIQTLAARLSDPNPYDHPVVQRRQRLIQAKTKELLSKFQFLILEEAHEASGESYYQVVNQCTNAHYRLALTATPGMKDSEEDNMRLTAVAGNIGIRVTEKDLIDRGILATPYFKYISTKKPEKLLRSTSWQRAYKLGITDNKYRNQVIVDEAVKMSTYGLTGMILVQYTGHGDILRAMLKAKGLRVEFLRGEVDQRTRQRHLRRLGLGEIDVLLGTNVLDVGVDVPSVGYMILAGGFKAEVQLRQRIGRTLRRKKSGPNVAFIVDFTDEYNTHIHDHALQRRYIVENTPGFGENILSAGEDFNYAVFS